MLKLCLAHPIFYPTFGGGSLRFLRYQPGLQKRDVQTRVLAGTSRAKDAKHPHGVLDWDRHPVGHMLPVESVEGVPVHRVRLPDETSVRRTSTYFRALIALCRDPATRPDVIQLHSFERLESLYWIPRLRRLGIPIVYAIQLSSPLHHRSRLVAALHPKMLRRFYDQFDGVVTQQRADRRPSAASRRRDADRGDPEWCRPRPPSPRRCIGAASGAGTTRPPRGGTRRPRRGGGQSAQGQRSAARGLGSAAPAIPGSRARADRPPARPGGQAAGAVRGPDRGVDRGIRTPGAGSISSASGTTSPSSMPLPICWRFRRHGRAERRTSYSRRWPAASRPS
jgi:glycosyltransferase involved in cell wall biosynthesis